VSDPRPEAPIDFDAPAVRDEGGRCRFCLAPADAPWGICGPYLDTVAGPAHLACPSCLAYTPAWTTETHEEILAWLERTKPLWSGFVPAPGKRHKHVTSRVTWESRLGQVVEVRVQHTIGGGGARTPAARREETFELAGVACAAMSVAVDAAVDLSSITCEMHYLLHSGDPSAKRIEHLYRMRRDVHGPQEPPGLRGARLPPPSAPRARIAAYLASAASGIMRALRVR